MTKYLNSDRIGVYPDLEIEEYHRDNAVGSSGIKLFKDCPYMFKYFSLDKNPWPESKAMAFGSNAHIALLEPDIFNSKFKIGDKNLKKDQRTKEWKNFAIEAIKEGKMPLAYAEYKNFFRMADMIKECEVATQLLTGGKAELSFFGEENGIIVKSRPDYLVNIPGEGIYIVDYKTVSVDMSTWKQSNHALSLSRHIQAAHHKKVAEIASGGKINGVIYVTQMSKAPYLVRLFRMPESLLQRGDDERKHYLNLMKECFEKNDWPKYSQEIEDYIEPKWLDSDYN